MRFSIYKYVRLGKVWRYLPAALDRGTPIKDMVLIDGQMAHHGEGCYYVRHKRKWIKAGPLPQDAIDLCLRLATPGEPEPERPALHTTAMRWLESYNVGKADRTKLAMELVLKNFLLSINGKALTINDVTLCHVSAYWQWEVDHSPTKSYRTAHNRVTSLKKFLAENGMKSEWKIPPFVEETPEVYEEEEIETLFCGSDARHWAAYATMLKALFREKEVVYLTWADVDAKRSQLRVKAKPQYGWVPKKYMERTVTVPRSLIELIETLPHTGPLVFGKEDGSPDLHLLRDLKTVATKVGIDPDRTWLHKFRATGCTTYLQKGMPLPDVMKLGGWRDLASVQRYMGLLNHDRLQAAVEAAWA